MPRMLFRLAAAAVLPAAVATHDASALLQSEVRLHDGRQHRVVATGMASAVNAAMQSFSHSLADIAATVVGRPNNGEVFVSRSIMSDDPGAAVTFNLNKGCTSSDQFGSNNCKIQWGENVTFVSKIHLASGVAVGDVVTLTMNGLVRAENQTDLSSSILKGQGATMSVACGVCDGFCTAKFTTGEKFSVDSTTPTAVDDAKLCEQARSGALQDFQLANWALQLPMGPPAEWQLSADVDVKMMVTRANGAVKVSEAMSLKVLPGAKGAELQRVRVPAAVQARSLPEAFSEVIKQAMANLPTKGHHAAPVKLSAVPKKKQKSHGPKLNALVMNVQVKQMEGSTGHNISLWSDSGCKAPDTLGSAVCKIPLGATTNLNAGIHMSTVVDAGSVMDLKIKVKVGGFLGAMASSLLTPMEVRLPLCGKGSVKLPTSAQPIEVDAGKCGYHAFNLVAPAMELALPSIAGLPIELPPGMPKSPMIPATFDQLPPISFEVDAQSKHADNTPIAGFKLEFGVGTL